MKVFIRVLIFTIHCIFLQIAFQAEQKDNPDRYAISTLNVGKKGNTNAPLHFVQPEFSVKFAQIFPEFLSV